MKLTCLIDKVIKIATMRCQLWNERGRNWRSAWIWGEGGPRWLPGRSDAPQISVWILPNPSKFMAPNGQVFKIVRAREIDDFVVPWNEFCLQNIESKRHFPFYTWASCKLVRNRIFLVVSKISTYNAYHPVQNKSSCGIVRAVMERRYTVMLPTLKAFLEISPSTWI